MLCKKCRLPYVSIKGCEICECKKKKYGNVKTNGFASQREANRAGELKLLERAGEISDLEFQPMFVVVPKTDKFRAVKYIADFRYRDKHGEVITEDAKGVKTKEFIIKQKLMYHVHGIEVVCV